MLQPRPSVCSQAFIITWSGTLLHKLTIEGLMRQLYKTGNSPICWHVTGAIQNQDRKQSRVYSLPSGPFHEVFNHRWWWLLAFLATLITRTKLSPTYYVSWWTEHKQDHQEETGDNHPGTWSQGAGWYGIVFDIHVPQQWSFCGIQLCIRRTCDWWHSGSSQEVLLCKTRPKKTTAKYGDDREKVPDAWTDMNSGSPRYQPATVRLKEHLPALKDYCKSPFQY